MAIVANKAEKITVTIPYELKNQLYDLKNELHTTMSAIYKEALQDYLKRKEQEKWANAVNLMQEEYENNPELSDWQEFEEEFYDYQTV